MTRKRIKSIVLTAALAAVIGAGLISCERYVYDPPTIDPDIDVLFATEVAPIFVNAACTGCHAGGINPDLRADKSYESLTTGGYVDLGTPASSKIYTKILSGHATSSNISDVNRLKLLTWIEQGAQNN